MDRLRRTKAGVNQTVRKRVKQVSDGVAQADDKSGQRLSAGADRAIRAVKWGGDAAQGKVTDGVRLITRYEKAKKTFDVTNRAIGELGRAPGVTVIADGIAARHGIAELVAQHAARPLEPATSIWLAEALLRAERDKSWAKLVRVVARPHAILLVSALKSLRGAEEMEVEVQAPDVPIVTQLLSKAYVLTLSRLDEQTTGVDLGNLARIYLNRGAAHESVRLAQCAVAIDDDAAAAAAVTLSLAHRRRRADDHAASAASLAVSAGSTVGYRLLVRLGRRVDGGPLDAATEADYVRRIDRADVVAYRGAAPTKTGMAIEVGGSQWKRTVDQGRRTAGWVRAKRQERRDV